MEFKDLHSTWARFEETPERSDILVVVFSNDSVGEGSFEFRSQLKAFGGDKLYLNCPKGGYFLDGVPGLATDMESMTSAIVQAAKVEGYNHIRALGAGAGGFAAIHFGARAKAEHVLTFSADFDLSSPLSPIGKGRGRIRATYKNGVNAIKSASKTRFTLFGSASDIHDLHQLSQVAGLKNVAAFALAGVRPGVLADLRDTPAYNALMKGFCSDSFQPPARWDNASTLVDDKDACNDLLKAKSLAGSGDWTGAVKLLASVVKKHKSADPALEQLGVYYLTVRDFPEAAKVLAKACKINPNISGYKARLAKALRSSGAKDQALWLLAGAENIREQKRAPQLVGRAFLAEGKYEEAIEYLKQGIKADRDNAGLVKALAQAYLKSGSFDTAYKLQKKAMAMEPDNAGTEHVAGVILARKGNYRKALPHLQKAFDAQPDHPGFAHQLAVALQQLRRPMDALNPIMVAIEKQPGNRGFALTGIEIAETLGDWELVGKLADGMLQSGEADADAHYHRGVAAMYTGQNIKRAVQDLRMAVALQPNNTRFAKALASFEKEVG